MNDNQDTTQQPNIGIDQANGQDQTVVQKVMLTPQMIGAQWATEAVREILAKTPEVAQLELHALQFMALNILSNEAYNYALGLGEVKGTERGSRQRLEFNEFKMKQIIRLFAQHIENGVVKLRSMAAQGKLQRLETTNEGQDEKSQIILTDANEGNTNETSC